MDLRIRSSFLSDIQKIMRSYWLMRINSFSKSDHIRLSEETYEDFFVNKN